MAQASRGVLVIDDDSDIRSVVRELLTDEGYQVRTAVNGRDALSTLSSWQPDVILLDLMMPIMDGWTFLANQQSSQQLRRIPVIVMSASHTLTRGDEQLAVADVVAKPFEIDTVLTKVATLAGRPCIPQQPSSLAS
jgi:two-component system, chemotaxis family, chemotaxis protein CheY